MAAILPSRMEVSCCTSGFFSKLSPPSNFVIKRELPFPSRLKGEGGGVTVPDPIFRIKLRNFPKTLQVYIMYRIVTLVTDFQP